MHEGVSRSFHYSNQMFDNGWKAGNIGPHFLLAQQLYDPMKHQSASAMRYIAASTRRRDAYHRYSNWILFDVHVRLVRTDATAIWYTCSSLSSPLCLLLCMKWRQMHCALDVMDPLSDNMMIDQPYQSQCPVNACMLPLMNCFIAMNLKGSSKWSEVKWKFCNDQDQYGRYVASLEYVFERIVQWWSKSHD